MKYTTSDKIIAWLTLFSGLTISAVAIYYSVAGLTAIFAAAVIPIIVMGIALEVSKLAATVWLKQNWTRAPNFIRGYLLAAIAILMLITSMGIFGFLSKAHSDQSLVSGDVQSKIAVYDEKIKTAKDNIEANRKALRQMDEAVDQVMGRSSDEKGADKAVALRRSQQKERARLQSEIAAEQKTIAAISEERAPIAAEVRKVEAEVGPIKYIANFIYGDNPDANVLEKAVTWVIIIIVIVFDPLAVILLLASQYSFQWFRKQEEEENKVTKIPEEFFKPENHIIPPVASAVTQEELDSLLKEEEPPKFEQGSVYWPFPAQEPMWKMTTTTTPVETDLAEEANAKIAEIEKEDSVELQPEQEVPIQELEEAAKEFHEDDFKFLPDDKDLYPEGKPWEDDDDDDENDSEELKAAKRDWKHDHPNDSLKRQRKLFEQGIIKRLPWDNYLEAKPDNMDISKDEAALEAMKWAKEQEIKYQQNSEQSNDTIWKKIQESKQ